MNTPNTPTPETGPVDRGDVELALSRLYMAYDLRKVGDPLAYEYERSARQALCNALGWEQDRIRGDA